MQKSKRKLVIVSGYYGFGNLGDEAILEGLVGELKQLVGDAHIVVLSDNPQDTISTFHVRAVSRWQPSQLLSLLPAARLFISGGGGLFQDSVNLRSIFFYGGQILMARLSGVPIMVYAQGLGPIKSVIAKLLTRFSLSFCRWITVRDAASMALLKDWGIKAQLTADPVFCLESSPLPERLDNEIAHRKAQGLLIGLSLRTSKNFTPRYRQCLFSALRRTVPPEATLVALPLMDAEDAQMLKAFGTQWEEQGLRFYQPDLSELTLPSQWLMLIRKLDMLVGMRLHALIMSLKCGVPCVGIAYDPKVTHLLTCFDSPILSLDGHLSGQADATEDVHDHVHVNEWSQVIGATMHNIRASSTNSSERVESAREMACQNFNLLAKILST